MGNELLDVVSVQCVDGHLLRLRFEDGVERLFDMKPWFARKPYCVLKDSPLFDLARIEFGTVVWPGEIDIDPETLRNGSRPSAPAASEPYPDIDIPPLSVAEPDPPPYS